MWQVTAKAGLIDRLAIGLSGLCVVHCIGTAVLVAFLAAGGSFLLNPAFHEIGLCIALVLGAFGLGRGIWVHGFMLPSSIGGLGLGMMAGSLALPHGETEMLCSIVGVLLLALGHDLNRRAVC
jgi:hypothetical protein